MQLADSLTKAWGNKISFEQIIAVQGEVFREVAKRRTLRFVLGEASFFIKIHEGVGWLEIFKNLSQGKLPVLGAANEYKAIVRLETLNVETMTIAGFGERGLNPAKKQSFLITNELVNTVSLEDYCGGWVAQKPAFALKLALIKKVAGIARKLHSNGVNHRDFYLCHFLLDPESIQKDQLTLYLIDLHRTQIRVKTPQRWLLKDLSSLYFSAMDIGLTANDIVRFVRYYRGSPLRTIGTKEKFFWAKVQVKAEKLYASHNHKPSD